MPKFVTANLSNNAEPCILRYTTSDNEMINIKAARFDAEIISHIYNNGEGQIIFNKSIRMIGNWAFYDSNLTSVIIPNSVTQIGDCAFLGCCSLTGVTIPDRVTQIGDRAFYCCSRLTSVTIPNRVTKIGMRAFSDCSSLQTIICKSTTPPILEDMAFLGIPSNATIIIPEGSEEAYANSDWRKAL